MRGVNLPAHFMCRSIGDGLKFLIDAHADGKITFLQDAEERLSVVYGVLVEINPEFLKHTSITNRVFLLRLLSNLKRMYFERKDPVSTLCIIVYLRFCDQVSFKRDYGICLYLLNRFSEAIPCLDASGSAYCNRRRVYEVTSHKNATKQIVLRKRYFLE
ncbi:uncharacterized protein [Physcomitrium patens]|uniref:Protein SirB1 N-terminal domain-containing protein n=1 Tax=Physcomitrium patens TaxID=3218 RepID=A0A2K1IN91_PHYPA|nr:hypothetical protein PHYPA_027057 [Physcomitrium patens]